MTRPITEPTSHNRVRGNQWGVNQLQRRPSRGSLPSAWHYVGDTGEPAFQNSWVNIGADIIPTRFRLNGEGETEIELGCSGGDADSVIFALPVGYRPGYTQEFAVSNGIGGTANVRTLNNGNVLWAT